MVHNNLCPVCNKERIDGVDISHKVVKYKIDPTDTLTSDVIEVCVHDGMCSILDLGVCACGIRGFLLPPEDQTGILIERSDLLQQLNLDLVSDNMGAYCKTCSTFETCEVCGASTRTLLVKNLILGQKRMCTECASTYRACRICGIYATEYNNELDDYVCDNCKYAYVKCSCGSLILKEAQQVWVDGTKCCHHCTNITNCAYCGKETTCKYTDDMYICKDHWDICKDLPKVRGYGHTQATEFNKAASDSKQHKLFFGIENEFQINISRTKFPTGSLPVRRRILTKEVNELFPTASCKRDGSLNLIYNRRSYDVGVEVAWQPMTFNYIKDNADLFKQMFANIIKGLHKNMPQAGMHIHLSKDAFTPFHFLKFTNFFYMQEKYPFLIAIAGRYPNHYARVRATASMNGARMGERQTGKRLAYADISNGGLARNSKLELKTKSRHYFSGDRYDIVNITNTNTYEIRIFKAARTYSEFMSRVEFVHSIYMYTKDVSHKSMGIDNYFLFVERNARTYPELLNVVTKYKGGI